MQILKPVGEALKPVVDLVYPPRCPLCGDALGEQGGLCLECWSTLVIPSGPSCVKCGRPVGEEYDDATICAPCLAHPPLHDGIAAATLYNDASRKLVLTFKHGRRIALAKLMGQLMVRQLGAIESNTLLVPVPLHRSRIWMRGFNQSALLVTELAKRAGGEIGFEVLKRTKATPSLGGLRKAERAAALRGAIQISRKWQGPLKGRKVILVDDVFTSGATTSACVRALKKAGAANVVIACFSRVLDEALPPGPNGR